MYDFKFWFFFDRQKLKLIRSGYFQFQQTFEEITGTSPYCGNLILKFESFVTFSFCAHNSFFRVDFWRLFWILVAFLKNHLHMNMLLGMSCQIKKKMTNSFLSFCAHKKTWRQTPVSSEIRHGVDIRHDLNSYSLRMTVCNAYGWSCSIFFTLM